MPLPKGGHSALTVPTIALPELLLLCVHCTDLLYRELFRQSDTLPVLMLLGSRSRGCDAATVPGDHVVAPSPMEGDPVGDIDREVMHPRPARHKAQPSRFACLVRDAAVTVRCLIIDVEF